MIEIEEKLRALLHETQAKLAEYKARELKLLEFIKCAPVSSGVCYCGDSMENHPSPITCGHTPVDAWDYSVHCFLEEFEKLTDGH